MKRFIGTVAAVLAAMNSIHAEELPDGMQLLRTIPLPNIAGRIDHLSADIPNQRLFVTALGSNSVEVVDLLANKLIKHLDGLNEPQGVVYAAQVNKLFVSNGGDGTVVVYDAEKLERIGKIEFEKDADNLRYDPSTKRLYVGYGAGAIGIVDATTLQRTGDIKLPGHPESFQLERRGTLAYVNVPTAEQIAVVDKDTEKTVATWPIHEAKGNFPMAFDEENRRLYVACRRPARVLVLEVKKGKVEGNVEIKGDPDDMFYTPRRKRLYVSCGEGFIDMVAEAPGAFKGTTTYKVIARTPTVPGARTSLYIPELDRLCLAVPRRGEQPAEIRIYKPLDVEVTAPSLPDPKKAQTPPAKPKTAK